MTYITPGELNLILRGANPMCAHAWWRIPYSLGFRCGPVGMLLMKAIGWAIIEAKYVLGPGDCILAPSGLIVYDLARSN